jgi:myb proto-oncogene protein
MGYDPTTHQPRTDFLAALPQLIALASLRGLVEQRPWDDHTARQLQAYAVQAAKLEYLQCLLQSAATIATSPSSSSINTIPTALERMGLLSALHMSSLSSPWIMEGINGQGLVTEQLPDIQIPGSSFFQQPITNGTIQNSGYTANNGEGENSLPTLADFSISNLDGACSTSGCDAEGNSAQLPIWSDSILDQFMSELA